MEKWIKPCSCPHGAYSLFEETVCSVGTQIAVEGSNIRGWEDLRFPKEPPVD